MWACTCHSMCKGQRTTLVLLSYHRGLRDLTPAIRFFFLVVVVVVTVVAVMVVALCRVR